MIVATLDLGTNTCLLLIAEMENGKILRVLHDQAEVVRLGQGVNQSKMFHADALKRAETCFQDFAQTIQRFKAEKILAYATSATRDAANRDELFKIGQQFGIPITVISGQKEAECTFAGTLSAEFLQSTQDDQAVDKQFNIDQIGVIDVGGGSTELIIGTKKGIQFRQSVDVGAVRLTEMFVSKHPIAKAEVDQASQYIDQQMAPLRQRLNELKLNLKHVVLVAGTPTTLACVDQGKTFSESWVDGFQFPLAQIQKQFQLLTEMSIESRQSLIGMEPKRADVLPMGTLCLIRFCEVLRAELPVVSIRGLRYGMLYDF